MILKVAGKDQLLMTGCNVVAGFEPMTGKVLWETKGSTTECVTSTVTDGQLIFTSGGFPKNHVSAVRADGSGKVVWENSTRVYVPSMLVHDGYLYGVLDAGFAVCWKADSGKELWRGRLRGTFSASLVLVGEHLFATNESGRTFIFQASPKAFALVDENQLGKEVLTTPAFCGGCIFMRVAGNGEGTRQEMLYCLGKKGPARSREGR
jgi:outer membrane protein assembly factor BamB